MPAKIDCTACRSCLPCPVGVDIPGNFALLNDALEKNIVPTRSAYVQTFQPDARASNCMQCGLCEYACPQKLPVRRHLKEVSRAFSG